MNSFPLISSTPHLDKILKPDTRFLYAVESVARDLQKVLLERWDQRHAPRENTPPRHGLHQQQLVGQCRIYLLEQRHLPPYRLASGRRSASRPQQQLEEEDHNGHLSHVQGLPRNLRAVEQASLDQSMPPIVSLKLCVDNLTIIRVADARKMHNLHRAG